jgi:hypothetical protein
MPLLKAFNAPDMKSCIDTGFLALTSRPVGLDHVSGIKACGALSLGRHEFSATFHLGGHQKIILVGDEDQITTRGWFSLISVYTSFAEVEDSASLRDRGTISYRREKSFAELTLAKRRDPHGLQAIDSGPSG